MEQDRLTQILGQIQKLEAQILEELQQKEAEYGYKLHEKQIRFTKEIRLRHRQLKEKLYRYLFRSRFLVLLTTPVIYACLIPIALLDLVCTTYQWICFPLYGIPKVRRSDYLAFDRHHLSYLNLIEKINCEYCAYANGILHYAAEIAARTEQYWCPIKHFRCVKCAHKRYKNFLNFGDGEGYVRELEGIRQKFKDLHEAVPTEKT
ncbi:MAG: hypothetical protein EBV83_03720 [Verrucomicrobia bacterium]|nr:hypothetical protein [Verrucomicrobiota bacterium]